MKTEITNCGLIALSNIVAIKKTSMRTLIFAAKDNGVKLFPYTVDLNEMINVPLPAIFHAKNHFVYITSKEQFKDFEFTGYLLHTQRQPYFPVSSNDVKHIYGEMAWVAVGTTAVGAIMSGIQANKAKKDKAKIAQAAANMKENPLANVADGMTVSTAGADLRREQQAVLDATAMNTLAESGTRGILGGAGRVAGRSQEVNKDIAVNQDEQQKQIDAIRADDNGKIRMTKEQRQQAKLAALSSQYNAANVSQQQGNANVINGVGTAGLTTADYLANKPKGTNKIDPTASTTFSGASTSVPSSIGWKK